MEGARLGVRTTLTGSSKTSYDVSDSSPHPITGSTWYVSVGVHARSKTSGGSQRDTVGSNDAWPGRLQPSARLRDETPSRNNSRHARVCGGYN